MRISQCEKLRGLDQLNPTQAMKVGRIGSYLNYCKFKCASGIHIHFVYLQTGFSYAGHRTMNTVA